MIGEDIWNKKFHAERVKRSAEKSVVVVFFQRTSPEDWGSYNENNHFSKMKNFEQWNYGDGKRRILTSIKRLSSSMKRHPVHHAFMPLHTMHKPDFYSTICSPNAGTLCL